MFRLSNGGFSGICRFLLIALLTFGASFTLSAQITKSLVKSPVRGTTPAGGASQVAVAAFTAESYSGVTNIAWQTSYEKNILGFRVWRDDAGRHELVEERMIAGSLMQVGGGVLEAGGSYEMLDTSGSTNVYYWVEAIDINQQSRWFGPVYPTISFDKYEIDAMAEKVAARTEATGNAQIDRLAAQPKTPALKSVAAEQAVMATGSLLANNSAALKIEVKGRGIYRVEAATLTQNGFSAAQSANWRLFAGSTEQPIIVNTDGSIDFFGQGVDTVQSDTQIYWLVTDIVAGRRIARQSQTFVKNANYSWSRVIAERRDKTYLITSVLNGAAENFYGAVVGTTATNQTLSLSDIATTSGATATIYVDLQGLTYYAHQVNVSLNGSALGTMNFLAMDRATWSATIPLSRLVEGTNTVTLQSVASSSDINITESIRISYPRNNRARGDRAEFTIAAGSQPSVIKGFSNPAIRVFDVTNPAQPVEIVSVPRLDADGTYMVSLPGAATTRNFFAVAGNNNIARSTSVTRNNSSDLRNAQNGAKMIIIGPAEFHSTLAPLAALRSSQGISTTIVDVEDIYDEFNNGVRSAESIRSFLQYAKQNWSVKPDFVLLAGDTSNDPRNYTGAGGPIQNRIPVFFVDTWNMETVSDEMLADFNYDGVGEIALGRLPALNVTELQAMLDKIMTSTPMTVSEINARGIHFVSDAPIGYDFSAGSRNMATYFPAGSNIAYVDANGRVNTEVRADIVNRFNSGPAIVNYFGHGSVGIWASSQIFRTTDAATLYNPGRASFVAMIDCLNGYYPNPSPSLAEATIKRPNGGANAVWASSGWNSAYDQEYFARDFYQKVYSGMALGEAARQTKLLYGNQDLRVSYIFFGDPSQPLVR